LVAHAAQPELPAAQPSPSAKADVVVVAAETAPKAAAVVKPAETVKAPVVPVAAAAASDKASGRGWLIGVSLMLIAAAAAAAIWWRKPPAPAVSLADMAPMAANSPSAPAAADEPTKAPAAAPQEAPKAATASAAALPPASKAPAKSAKEAATPAKETLRPDTDKVVAIEGTNPDKPSGAFFVSAREPAVIFKKQRDDAGGGARIDVRRGAKVRIALAKNELVRVAEGRNLDVYYQGRKVSPGVVQSGAWMQFVAQTSGPPPVEVGPASAPAQADRPAPPALPDNAGGSATGEPH